MGSVLSLLGVECAAHFVCSGRTGAAAQVVAELITTSFLFVWLGGKERRGFECVLFFLEKKKVLYRVVVVELSHCHVYDRMCAIDWLALCA